VRNQTEAQLQIQVADYIRLKYPNVLFHSDFGSGIKLTMGQAAKQKRQNGGRRAWPDMFIAKPVCYENCGADIWTHGLFIELKRQGERIHPGNRAKNRFLSKDGKEYTTQHLCEQADTLLALREAGYAAEFAIGFDEAIKLIDSYLS